jgi:AcrR family transcriptional regulator
VIVHSSVKDKTTVSPRDKDTPLSTRDHILDAAVSVIESLGLGRATTREIAQAAGLSEAAMYRYFADKTELFLCVIGERLPQLIAILKDLPSHAGERSVRANLEDVARVALQFYEQTIPIVTSLFAEPELLARHQEQLRLKNMGPHRTNEMLAAYVRAEQRYGRVNERADADAVAALLIGSCLARAMACRFLGDEPSPEDDQRFARSVVRTLMIGLAPEDKP